MVLQEIYVNNYEAVRRLVLNNNGNELLAKDIYQEAVIVLFEKVKDVGFQLTSSIGTFLYAIARRLWLKYLRQKEYQFADVNELAEVLPDRESVPEPVETDEREKKVCQAVHALGEPCSKLLKLYYYQQLRMEEIAKEMQYANAATAKNQKAKCMKRLRKKYQEMGVTG